MKKEDLGTCIRLYTNVFDSGKKFIDLLESECSQEWSFLNWVRAQVGDGYISDVRTSMSCELSPLSNYDGHSSRISELHSTWIDIFQSIDKTVWDYRDDFELELSGDENYRVLRYGKGAEYRAHQDHGPNNERVLCLVCFLNDDFSGGELVFPHFDVEIKPQAGSCVLFPSNFPYLHIAKPAGADDETVKYSLVTWFK